jgi:hypothetical protein
MAYSVIHEMTRRFLERAVADVGVVIAGCQTYDRSAPWWALTARAGWFGDRCPWFRTGPFEAAVQGRSAYAPLA